MDAYPDRPLRRGWDWRTALDPIRRGPGLDHLGLADFPAILAWPTTRVDVRKYHENLLHLDDGARPPHATAIPVSGNVRVASEPGCERGTLVHSSPFQRRQL